MGSRHLVCVIGLRVRVSGLGVILSVMVFWVCGGKVVFEWDWYLICGNGQWCSGWAWWCDGVLVFWQLERVLRLST